MEEIKWVAQKDINLDDFSSLMELCSKTNTYTNFGPIIPLLENALTNLFQISDSKEVIVTSNGTTALHALIAGLNIFHKRSLKFATQAFTFPSSNQGPLSDSKILDIDTDGGLNLENLNYSGLDGLIITNIHGNVVDIDKYVDFCQQHNLYLLFDNAATGYTFYKGRNSVNYGLGSIVSFHHTKPFGFGEGGCIIVSKEFAHCIRISLNFGYDNRLNVSATHSMYASNYRMCDINAAVILSYLQKNFNKIVSHHSDVYQLYKNSHLGHFKLFPNFGDLTVPSSICLLYDQPYFDNTKLPFFTRKYYKPLATLPISVDFYNRVVNIPCNLDISLETHQEVINFLNDT